MSGGKGASRSWWATWPGALALGLVSLPMVITTAVSLLLISVLAPTGASGTDLTEVSSPSLAWRIIWAVVGVACLALPVAVVVTARRQWLGWLLVMLALSTFALAAGLWALGIL